MTLSPNKSESTAELSLYELAAKIARETLGSLPDTQPAEEESSSVKHVLFVLDDTQYAVPMENVLELQRLPRITPLPGVPDWLRGVTNLRGDVLSVIDLRSMLGLPAVESSTSQRLIVVRSTFEEIVTGWVVDRVIGIRHLATENVQPTSTLATGASTNFLNRVVEHDHHQIAVLDVNRVLASPEMREFEPMWPGVCRFEELNYEHDCQSRYTPPRR